MRTSIRRVLDDIAAKQPDDLLSAGDLADAHWGADVQATRFFGPARTRVQRRRQIRRLGRFYYGEWAERWHARGYRPHVAPGDHAVGDNPLGRDGVLRAGLRLETPAVPGVQGRVGRPVHDQP